MYSYLNQQYSVTFLDSPTSSLGTRPKVDVRADDDPVVADAEKGGLPSQHTEAESMAVDKYDGEKASSKQIIASATTSVGQERANDDDEQQGAIADQVYHAIRHEIVLKYSPEIVSVCLTTYVQRVVHPLPMHPLGEEPADVALARPAAPPTSSISGNQTSQPGHEVKSGDTAKITSTVLKPVGEISGNSLKALRNSKPFQDPIRANFGYFLFSTVSKEGLLLGLSLWRSPFKTN